MLAAANVSVARLRRELREGRLAREQIVVSNVRLVGHLVQKLKRNSGGRICGGQICGGRLDGRFGAQEGQLQGQALARLPR